MLRFLQLAGEAVANTYRAVVEWVSTVLGGSSDPTAWTATVWSAAGLALLLVVLVLLLVAAARRRRRRRFVPEMMMSHGEIALLGDGDRAFVESKVDGSLDSRLEAPAGGKYLLKLALSNLNPYPVQLLELAVRAGRGGLPVVAEAGAVVPPNGAVDVAADLFDLPGHGGVIELYLYSNKLKARTFRLAAPLEWEPWARRYRVKALEGRTEAAPRLASEDRRRFEGLEYARERRQARRAAFAGVVRERTDGLRRQVEGYRAARAERDRSAASAAARATDETRPPVGGSTPVPATGSESGAPTSGSPTLPDAPVKRGLQFPDEF
ncbi:MAG: hypothetical protein KF875_13770 [Trueperaceae bacterium]|nr:hypothetical protein [Trueperaceae bacterium]MCO5173826.1 hypothetical protein [Trueperaceae bacterium]MCW5818940.1 hypothetical protein [Trueperaceae bacterium]